MMLKIKMFIKLYQIIHNLNTISSDTDIHKHASISTINGEGINETEVLQNNWAKIKGTNKTSIQWTPGS